MVAMTAMVAWQVFARYVLNASPSWTEPASVMVMSWFIFLGAAVGVRENFHMGFDVLRPLPAREHRAVDAGDLRPRRRSSSASAWSATAAARHRHLDRDHPGRSHLPGGFTYMPIVAGGVLMALFALERLVLRAGGRHGRPRPERRRRPPERRVSAMEL